MSAKVSVITTINNIEDTFIKNFIDEGYNCIVVGDKKTNPQTYEHKKSIHYVETDCNVFSQFSKSLPYNHYGRKNLGYLHAINQKFKSILDTDDDNFPKHDIFEWKNLEHSLVLGPSLPNILKHFSDSHIWARGYPLELICIENEPHLKKVSDENLNNVGIIQSLVDGDPDVDAIFRLSSQQYTDNFSFKSGKSCIMEQGIFSQGNTQATLWIDPKLFHLLYIPVTVSFRFCDILKMYVAQRCMWEYGSMFAITSPFFHQTRNAHDYMKDFESEVSMYKCLHKLLTDILPSIKLKGDIDDIVRVYEVLKKENIVQAQELKTLKLFLAQL